MKAIVKVIYDSGKGKLRVQPVGMSGFVRFPNHLRIEGAMYEVENLKPGRAGSWIASGAIKPVSVAQSSISYRKAA